MKQPWLEPGRAALGTHQAQAKGQLKIVWQMEPDWKLTGQRVREQSRNFQVSVQGPGGSGEAETRTQGQGWSGTVRAAWAYGPKELGMGARICTHAVASCTSLACPELQKADSKMPGDG